MGAMAVKMCCCFATTAATLKSPIILALVLLLLASPLFLFLSVTVVINVQLIVRLAVLLV